MFWEELEVVDLILWEVVEVELVSRLLGELEEDWVLEEGADPQVLSLVVVLVAGLVCVEEEQEEGVVEVDSEEADLQLGTLVQILHDEGILV